MRRLGNRLAVIAGGFIGAAMIGFPLGAVDTSKSAVSSKPEDSKMQVKVEKSEEEWKKVLGPEQFRVLREKGTERAFTGKYWNHKEKGAYKCAGCGAMLFSSEAKFDSGCGWPSFSASVATNTIKLVDDFSHSMHRTEVLCARCGGHLGHLFEDGPRPTGLRYCINSVSLDFDRPAAEAKPAADDKADPGINP
ncbi:MAG: peptide-methionine (R)-S-oxide reductase MsrB [Limisphaerales bacterium]